MFETAVTNSAEQFGLQKELAETSAVNGRVGVGVGSKDERKRTKDEQPIAAQRKI